MAEKIVQIADKPTLDKVKELLENGSIADKETLDIIKGLLENSTYGLEALKTIAVDKNDNKNFLSADNSGYRATFYSEIERETPVATAQNNMKVLVDVTGKGELIQLAQRAYFGNAYSMVRVTIDDEVIWYKNCKVNGSGDNWATYIVGFSTFDEDRMRLYLENEFANNMTYGNSNSIKLVGPMITPFYIANAEYELLEHYPTSTNMRNKRYLLPIAKPFKFSKNLKIEGFCGETDKASTSETQISCIYRLL